MQQQTLVVAAAAASSVACPGPELSRLLPDQSARHQMLQRLQASLLLLLLPPVQLMQLQLCFPATSAEPRARAPVALSAVDCHQLQGSAVLQLLPLPPA
jgi:hypothetical protein